MNEARAAVDGTTSQARPEVWQRGSTPASTIGPWLPEGVLGDEAGTQAQESLHLGRHVLGPEVEVDAVLGDRGLGDVVVAHWQ